MRELFCNPINIAAFFDRAINGAAGVMQGEGK
jgi:hypothetical protein